VIGAIGDREELASLSRETSPEPTAIQVRGRRIRADHFGFIAATSRCC
jgi:hypothetical protein